MNLFKKALEFGKKCVGAVQAGVSAVSGGVGKVCAAVGAGVLVLVGNDVRADTGAIDLSGVTGGIDSLKTAVVTAAALVITAGMSLMAIKFGGRWIVKVFKSFSS